MKKLLFIFFTAGLIQGFSSCSHKDTPDNALALIPQPQEMKVGTDHFKLTRRAAITLDTSNPQLIGIARYFNNKVAPATGFEIPVEKHGNIEFKLTDNTAFGAEGYRLQATRTTATWRRNDLRRLLHTGRCEGSIGIRCRTLRTRHS